MTTKNVLIKIKTQQKSPATESEADANAASTTIDDNNLMLSKINLESSIFWQNIIALDVKFNSSRYFCTYMKILYIKRRNQLFRELSKKPLNSFRKQYLQLRHKILSELYQNDDDQQQQQQKKHVRNSSDSSFLSFIYDDLRSYSGGDGGGVDSDWKSNITMTNDIIDNNVQFHSTIDKNSNPNNNNNVAFCENFAFTGVHHIFDQHKAAVNCVKFANSNKSLICFASDDHTLSICQLMPSPATILFVLNGHQDAVTSFEWSQSNDLIVSCSIDSTLNLWSTIDGKCLRRFKDPQKCPILVCIFLPINNNMIFTGNQNGMINILNLSTGIYSKNSVNICGNNTNNISNSNINQNNTNETNIQILSMCFETNGQLLWCGDTKGFITTFRFEMETCKLLLMNKVIIVPGCPITSLSSTSIAMINNDDDDNRSVNQKNLLLLANCSCDAVVLFRTNNVNDQQQLEFMKCFPIKHKNKEMKIKSSFCPNIEQHRKQLSSSSTIPSICIVTGSEDTCIYFYHYQPANSSKKTPTISRCVNKLQGHSAPVLDVCFNYDESLLASADAKGSIIIWKRDSMQSIYKNF